MTGAAVSPILGVFLMKSGSCGSIDVAAQRVAVMCFDERVVFECSHHCTEL